MTLAPGLGTLLLAGLGMASIRSRSHKALPWLLVTLAFAWLSFGPHAPVDAFKPLHSLPLFSSMRGPLRYLNYPLVLGLCVLAGFGFQVLMDHLPESRRSWGIPLLAAIVLGLCLPNALDVRRLYRSSFLYGIENDALDPNVLSEGLRGRSSSATPKVNLRKYVNIRRDLPTIYVPEDLPFDVRALPRVWVDADGEPDLELEYKGEAWVEPSEVGRANIASRKGQVLVVEHTLTQPARIVLNANAWEGWKCGGRSAGESDGLLAFEAPAGEAGRTVCRWSQPKLGLGITGSVLGFLGLIFLWPWRANAAGRRKARDRDGETPSDPPADTTS